MEEPNDAVAFNASMVTLQQLMGAPTGDADADCARFVEGIFDHFDAAYFDLIAERPVRADGVGGAHRARHDD